MNILKRELRAGLKAFIFWSIGLFVLVFIGIAKYQGVSAGGVSMNELAAKFPRIVQAMMGFAGVDITSLVGYTAVLTYYVLLCAVIYAVHLGSSAVSRESVDKTYEFLFTKPCPRSRVLAMKLLAAWIFFFLFCLLSAVFSLAAVGTLKTSENITSQILAFALAVFLIGSVFLAMSAFFAAMSVKPEKGALYGNLAFLYAFAAGVVYDTLEHPGLFRLLSPLRYFTNAELTDARISLPFTALCLVLTAAFLWRAFRRFDGKDLL